MIVFTDLDGTLLDHETYSHAPAAPALERLRALNIPLILASSKTAAEIAPLRAELGFSHCEAIVENGSGILPPHDDGAQAGGRYEDIRKALDSLPSKLRKHYRGFGDWNAEEVAARTGLSLGSATKAKQRRFSEPGLWSGSDREREEFTAALADMSLKALQGGRFLTLSFGGDKAERMAEICARYAHEGKPPFSVALGDAPNDLAMITQADKGVIIPNPGHAGIPRFEKEASGHVLRAHAPGPAGWNQSLMQILQDTKKTRS